VKLVFQEAESGALALWLTDQQGLPKLSSEVAVIELVRTCRRRDEEAEPSARRLLAGLDLVPLTPDLVEGACLARPAELRNLDAIHLACAVSLADALSYFVAYDAQLSSAAAAAGLSVMAPA
jgi:predicted nucleic acid-binding protein